MNMLQITQKHTSFGSFSKGEMLAVDGCNLALFGIYLGCNYQPWWMVVPWIGRLPRYHSSNRKLLIHTTWSMWRRSYKTAVGCWISSPISERIEKPGLGMPLLKACFNIFWCFFHQSIQYRLLSSCWQSFEYEIFIFRKFPKISETTAYLYLHQTNLLRFAACHCHWHMHGGTSCSTQLFWSIACDTCNGGIIKDEPRQWQTRFVRTVTWPFW